MEETLFPACTSTTAYTSTTGTHSTAETSIARCMKVGEWDSHLHLLTPALILPLVQFPMSFPNHFWFALRLRASSCIWVKVTIYDYRVTDLLALAKLASIDGPVLHMNPSYSPLPPAESQVFKLWVKSDCQKRVWEEMILIQM